MTNTLQHATFAGGCFWCMEPVFAGLDGVSQVVSGYIGGKNANPTYEQVCTGETGHIEAIDVTYDPSVVNYAKLLDIFWKNIDPLDPYGQFADKGSQYRAGIFTHDDAQATLAEASRQQVSAIFGRPVASFVHPAPVFYPAEDYHQEFFIKNRTRYKNYAENNGRKERLQAIWSGKPLATAS